MSTILRPDGDITCSLVCSTGSSHYALLDESTLDTSDYVYKSSPGNNSGAGTGSDLLSASSFTNSVTLSKVIGWFYLGGSTTTFTIKIYTGTTELASSTVTTPSSAGWYSVTYTGDLTQSEIDGLRLYVGLSVADNVSAVSDGKGGYTYTYSAGTGACYMAYIEAVPHQYITPGGIASTNAFGTARLKLYLLPTGIAKTNAFGSATVAQGKTIAPSGIASATAYGSPGLNFTITPSAITGAAAFGAPRLKLYLTPGSITSSLAFGMAGIGQMGYLAPSAVASSAAFGLPSLKYNQILTPAPRTTAAAFGTLRLGLYIIPTPPALTAAVGAPVLKPQQFITLSGIARTAAFGSLRIALYLKPSGFTHANAFGTLILTKQQFILPSGRASTLAFGTVKVSQGKITITGIPSHLVFGAVAVLRDRIHLILSGEYATASEEVNRSYVVGQDLSGAAVTGSAITQAEVDLVGERLEVQHTPEATTSTVAGYVAANVLSKARLGSKKAGITIPPHCGMELWDVINIYDDLANQSANYRVALYVFEYSVLQSRWHHQIELCAP